MSVEHRRPLYAFAVLVIVCGLFLGHAIRSEALVGVMRSAVDALPASDAPPAPPMRPAAVPVAPAPVAAPLRTDVQVPVVVPVVATAAVPRHRPRDRDRDRVRAPAPVDAPVAPVAPVTEQPTVVGRTDKTAHRAEKVAERAVKNAEKVAERAAKDAEKVAERAAKDAEKVADRATKDAEKAEKAPKTNRHAGVTTAAARVPQVSAVDVAAVKDVAQAAQDVEKAAAKLVRHP